MATAFEQALKLASSGDLAGAETLLRTENQTHPHQENVLSLLGQLLLRQQKTAEAVEVFTTMVEHHSQSPAGYAELASAKLSAGDRAGAEQAYRKAVELNPEYSEAWHHLGNLLMQKGDRENGVICFRNSQNTDPFAAQFVKVRELMGNKQYADAERICREVLQRHPNHSQALHTLAKLAKQLGAFEEAIDILNRGLRYAPYHISLWQALSENFTELGHYEQAIEAANRLVVLEPQNDAYWSLLGDNLRQIGRTEQYLQAFEKAQQLAPENNNHQLQIGHAHKTLGNREACEKAYLGCLERTQFKGTAYWSLADLKSFRFSDDNIQDMQAFMDNPQTPTDQATQAGFALAKAFEDRKDYEQAFKHYSQANDMRPDVNFDPLTYVKSSQTVAEAFDQKLLATQATPRPEGPTPIFIVGLPRSGSTLVEQILASHSAIEGTQELLNLPRLVRTINIRGGRQKTPYPQAMNLFNEQQLRDLGQTYLDQTKVYRTDKPYFIDKSPPNFHNVGLIHKILPNAIIIDTRRHPLSTGFSNFKQHFANGHDFSYNLENIGSYFNGYLELMDHWTKSCPAKY